MAYPHWWSPISCRSSAGRESSPARDRRSTTVPHHQYQSRYQKVKPICILLKQETVSGSGISWAICKSAPRSRQITTPAPHHSFSQARCPSCHPTNSIKALKAHKCTGRNSTSRQVLVRYMESQLEHLRFFQQPHRQHTTCSSSLVSVPSLASVVSPLPDLEHGMLPGTLHNIFNTVRFKRALKTHYFNLRLHLCDS